MPPKKYLTVEEGQQLLDTISALRASIDDLQAQVSSAKALPANAPVPAAAAQAPLGRLECLVYDGDAVVRMHFTSEHEAIKAINSLRRKITTQGINVAHGDLITCFRHLTRVVFSAELAQSNPVLLK